MIPQPTKICSINVSLGYENVISECSLTTAVMFLNVSSWFHECYGNVTFSNCYFLNVLKLVTFKNVRCAFQLKHFRKSSMTDVKIMF